MFSLLIFVSATKRPQGDKLFAVLSKSRKSREIQDVCCWYEQGGPKNDVAGGIILEAPKFNILLISNFRFKLTRDPQNKENKNNILCMPKRIKTRHWTLDLMVLDVHFLKHLLL